jgi:hypothetical protein
MCWISAASWSKTKRKKLRNNNVVGNLSMSDSMANDDTVILEDQGSGGFEKFARMRAEAAAAQAAREDEERLRSQGGTKSNKSNGSKAGGKADDDEWDDWGDKNGARTGKKNGKKSGESEDDWDDWGKGATNSGGGGGRANGKGEQRVRKDSWGDDPTEVKASVPAKKKAAADDDWVSVCHALP